MSVKSEIRFAAEVASVTASILYGFAKGAMIEIKTIRAERKLERKMDSQAL